MFNFRKILRLHAGKNTDFKTQPPFTETGVYSHQPALPFPSDSTSRKAAHVHTCRSFTSSGWHCKCPSVPLGSISALPAIAVASLVDTLGLPVGFGPLGRSAMGPDTGLWNLGLLCVDPSSDGKHLPCHRLPMWSLLGNCLSVWWWKMHGTLVFFSCKWDETAFHILCLASSFSVGWIHTLCLFFFWKNYAFEVGSGS